LKTIRTIFVLLSILLLVFISEYRWHAYKKFKIHFAGDTEVFKEDIDFKTLMDLRKLSNGLTILLLVISTIYSYLNKKVISSLTLPGKYTLPRAPLF
jgi:hypothetical protein